MEQKELTCIKCPFGCQINVYIEKGEVRDVKGNNCPRGETYAKKELSNPERIITSTIRVKNGDLEMLSIKTTDGIPKSTILSVMNTINGVKIEAPVNIGDIVLKDVCSTGVDIVATNKVSKK